MLERSGAQVAELTTEEICWELLPTRHVPRQGGREDKNNGPCPRRGLPWRCFPFLSTQQHPTCWKVTGLQHKLTPADCVCSQTPRELLHTKATRGTDESADQGPPYPWRETGPCLATTWRNYHRLETALTSTCLNSQLPEGASHTTCLKTLLSERVSKRLICDSFDQRSVSARNSALRKSASAGLRSVSVCA